MTSSPGRRLQARRAVLQTTTDAHDRYQSAPSQAQVDSAFCPPWDGKMSTSHRAMMLCGWGVKAGMV